MPTIVDIIIYAIIIFLIFYAIIPTEKDDLTCPDGPNTKDKSLCREGNGKTYNGSRAFKTDNVSVLLGKITIAAKANTHDVMWRKSFLAGMVCVIFLYMFVHKHFPSGCDMVLTIFITAVIFYFCHILYQHHHYTHIQKNITEAVDMLKSHVRVKNNSKT